ncbi:MAG: TldE/PmbA protein, TldE/TldD proteolytic complex [Marine Group I thaumarchaeote]|nr:MAG: TldE/PmbA protein [Nitrosopumilales archaeon]GFN40202.1 MAG: TldE/PmbA protein, TldE/TldD proteolytic complex [Marine Group I thaumarchaeote]
MSICEAVLSHAKQLKIDECEAYLVKRKILTVRITDSEIAEIKQNQEETLALRMINEKKIFSTKTNDFDNINGTVEEAFKSSSFMKPKDYWKSLPQQTPYTSLKNLYDKKLDEISGSNASDIAQTMINSASIQNKVTISGSLNVVSEEIEIANSNELHRFDKATYLAGTINANADIDTSVSGIGHESARTLDGFPAESVGQQAAEMCINSLNPQKCDQGTYTIIVEPYSMGELLAFVFSSNFNLKTYSEKRSCFSDKIGKQIAVQNFSLIDDPHASQGIGSKPFDDEGIPTQPRPLIDSGIFANTFSDSFYAFKEGTESSGNASRPGSPMGRAAEPIPFPSPHNLRVLGNGMSKNEIIKDTKKGILIGRLWYTYAVNPIRGDFSCTARSGIRIIENGEIKSPGKPVRIVHNLLLLLQNISAIGNDVKNVLQWNSLPSITPSVRIEDIGVVPIN